jgi:hypothetical protein
MMGQVAVSSTMMVSVCLGKNVKMDDKGRVTELIDY